MQLVRGSEADSRATDKRARGSQEQWVSDGYQHSTPRSKQAVQAQRRDKSESGAINNISEVVRVDKLRTTRFHVMITKYTTCPATTTIGNQTVTATQHGTPPRQRRRFRSGRSTMHRYTFQKEYVHDSPFQLQQRSFEWSQRHDGADRIEPRR